MAQCGESAEEREMRLIAEEESRRIFEDECKHALARDPSLCGGLCGVAPAECSSFPECHANEIVKSFRV
jgi:hypothetical protein